MPYTDNPSTNPLDAVRVLVGDTSAAAPDLTDNAIAFFLDAEGNNVLRAAARSAEALQGLYAKKAEERRVGPLWLRSFSDKSTKYAALAKRLWLRAAKSSGGVIPFAGGISATDKNSRIQNSDRVKPAFRRQMMSYPRGETQNMSPEEILSPSEPPI